MRRDRGRLSSVLVASCAPVPGLGSAQDAKSHAADAQHTESDVFYSMVHKRRIDRVYAASDDRKMAGRNVLGARARLRIGDVDGSVLNFHIRKLFAVLISVTGGPFAVAEIPFSSMRRADGVRGANLVGMTLHRADNHGMDTSAEQSHFAGSANSIDRRAF